MPKPSGKRHKRQKCPTLAALHRQIWRAWRRPQQQIALKRFVWR
jgi:hypothetical protein